MFVGMNTEIDVMGTNGLTGPKCNSLSCSCDREVFFCFIHVSSSFGLGTHLISAYSGFDWDAEAH